jgi:lysophospholipase L1-like esterase
MAKASRSVLFLATGASILFAVVLLLLVEYVAGFLVGPVHPQEIPGDAVSRTVTWLELNPAPLVRDVDLLWRNEPGARKTQLVNPIKFGRRNEWTIENNSEGMRGAERARPAAGEKVFRILCVGDSITFGFSVDQPYSYPEQLRTQLEQRYPGLRFEVINAGVPGWSWLQGLRFLDLHMSELDPDLVIIGHGTNDQFFSSRITDEERFRRLSGFGERTLQKIAAFAAETNTFRAFARNLPARPEDVVSRGCEEQIRLFKVCRRVSLDQIASAVRGVSALGAEQDVPILVANTDFVKTAAVEGVRRAVEADDVPFVDLVAEIGKLRQQDEDARATRLGLTPASQAASPPGEAASQPSRMVFRVLVPDASASYRVAGIGYFRKGFDFELPLHDDGTHGDEKFGDAVFSATLEVPAEIPAVEYRYLQGQALEFAPAPPFDSVLGDRLLHTSGDRIGPVDVFGESRFMVERAHPDREGHQINARLLADKIEELPAFREYVRGAERVDAAARPGD